MGPAPAGPAATGLPTGRQALGCTARGGGRCAGGPLGRGSSPSRGGRRRGRHRQRRDRAGCGWRSLATRPTGESCRPRVAASARVRGGRCGAHPGRRRLAGRHADGISLAAGAPSLLDGRRRECRGAALGIARTALAPARSCGRPRRPAAAGASCCLKRASLHGHAARESGNKRSRGIVN